MNNLSKLGVSELKYLESLDINGEKEITLKNIIGGYLVFIEAYGTVLMVIAPCMNVNA